MFQLWQEGSYPERISQSASGGSWWQRLQRPPRKAGGAARWHRQFDPAARVWSVPSEDRKTNGTTRGTVEGGRQCLPMELDTGAAVTLVSESTYRRFWSNRPLQECTTRPHTYTGERLTVLAQQLVPVQSGDQCATLPLVVVQGDGSSLLGHDWLFQLRLDWKEIHRLQSTDTVENILLKHKEVFQKGLGTPRGCKA